MGCKEWLRSIDGGSEELVCYADALEQKFTRLDDIISSYVRCHNGAWTVKPEFFADVGIENEKHRELIQNWFARGPTSKNAVQEETSPVYYNIGQIEICRDWLQNVDPTGECSCYAPQISKTFNHFKEVVEGYVRWCHEKQVWELDPEFFAEASINNAEHQQLFNQWFARGPPKPIGSPATSLQVYPPALQELFRLSLEEWLSRCDRGSGRLGRYRMSVQQNFDSVEQIAALHVFREAGVACGLEAQFFEDLGIDSADDRELFQASFREALLADGIFVPRDCQRTIKPRPAEAFRNYSFAAWLREVDNGGHGLLGYTDHLEEHYDTVEQIVELYSERGDDGCCVLHPVFYRDVSVEDEHHKLLFRQWFSCNSELPPEVSSDAESNLKVDDFLETNVDLEASLQALIEAAEAEASKAPSSDATQTCTESTEMLSVNHAASRETGSSNAEQSATVAARDSMGCMSPSVLLWPASFEVVD